jgi:Transposase DDE domain
VKRPNPCRCGTWSCACGDLHQSRGEELEPRPSTSVLRYTQTWWAQAEKTATKKPGKCFGDRYLERETRYWLDAVEDVSRRLSEHAPGAQPWFQLDRGADCWPVLARATEKGVLLTVRSSHDRRLEDQRGKRIYLRQTLEKQPVLGNYQLELPARTGRPARSARMALRSCKVVIQARVASKKWRLITVNAVLAKEVGHRGKDRLRWLLLTTAPVTGFEQARAVVHGYTLRWRVEEFHRAWKKGLCHVEDTQLQSLNAIVKWATILGAVAARAIRIAQLVRTEPDIPASDEFTDYEIAAVYALKKLKWDRRRRPSFKEIVDIIADLGGFTHKYSGGKPGPTVLGRGLAIVQIAAQTLQNIDEM